MFKYTLTNILTYSCPTYIIALNRKIICPKNQQSIHHSYPCPMKGLLFKYMNEFILPASCPLIHILGGQTVQNQIQRTRRNSEGEQFILRRRHRTSQNLRGFVTGARLFPVVQRKVYSKAVQLGGGTMTARIQEVTSGGIGILKSTQIKNEESGISSEKERQSANF